MGSVRSAMIDVRATAFQDRAMPAFTPPGAYGAADPLFLLLIALAVEAYLGGRPIPLVAVLAPRRALGRLVRELERRLNRPQRGARVRRVRGLIVMMVLAALAAVVGVLAQWLTRNYPFAWVLEAVLLVGLVDQRATWREAEAVRKALSGGSLIRAREALRPLVVGRLGAAELDRLGAPALVVAALTGLGHKYAVRLTAPVLWYVVFGLPGLFVQQTAHVAATCLIPHAGPFGAGARLLDAAVSAPARYLAALLLTVAAAFVPGSRPGAALGPVLRGRCGPDDCLVQVIPASPSGGRLMRAQSVFAVACLINAGLVAALALGRLAL
ncbi:MAG: hypothetical protein D6826_04025 [Alphaproteobacteria bacterium]|nr:MAG: hypothetical protein D6826_04025 [Alphaproteobacteria bacterium]